MPEAILAGVFGLLIGSFLNVCIYRWPRDLSVVKPRSFCPGCNRQIAWYDNIPVLSYLVLRGKCRHCSSAISSRYPLVELLTSMAFFWFVLNAGLTVEAAHDCALAAILIALIFADLETRLLPDQLTIGGLVAGLLFALLPPSHRPSILDSVIGAIVPSGALWLVGYLYSKVRGREGLGFGDIKMLAMMGAFLGLALTLFALVAGSLLGSILGLLYIQLAGKKSSEYELPFGLFLGIGGLLALTVGPAALRWYDTLF